MKIRTVAAATALVLTPIAVIGAQDLAAPAAPASAAELEASSASTINPVHAGDDTISGTAPAGVYTVWLKGLPGRLLASVRDGVWSVKSPLLTSVAAGTTFTAETQLAGGTVLATATVLPGVSPAPTPTLTVAPYNNGDSTLHGTVSGATQVVLDIPDGTINLQAAEVATNGSFSINLQRYLPKIHAGQVFTVYARDAKNQTLAKTTVTVGDTGVATPEAPVIAPDTHTFRPGKSTVTGQSTADTVWAYVNGVNKLGAPVRPSGEFSGYLTLKAGDVVTLKATDGRAPEVGGTVLGTTTVTVPSTTVTVAPYKLGETTLTGTAPGARVARVDVDPVNQKIDYIDVNVNKDGSFTADLQYVLKNITPGQPIVVESLDSNYAVSGTTTITVQ